MSASPQKSCKEDLIQKTGENRNRTCRKNSPPHPPIWANVDYFIFLRIKNYLRINYAIKKNKKE